MYTGFLRSAVVLCYKSKLKALRIQKLLICLHLDTAALSFTILLGDDEPKHSLLNLVIKILKGSPVGYLPLRIVSV